MIKNIVMEFMDLKTLNNLKSNRLFHILKKIGINYTEVTYTRENTELKICRL